MSCSGHPFPGVRGVAVALTRFERPVGMVQSYVVECECGWRSQHTRDWRRSLDDHYYREVKKRG
jgi:hypothetical protein